MVGYSGTPLLKKLGIKADFRLAFVHAPEHYTDLLGDLPENVEIITDAIDHVSTGQVKDKFYHKDTKGTKKNKRIRLIEWAFRDGELCKLKIKSDNLVTDGMDAIPTFSTV